tara:strand:- start:231 stop:488 length:258 start_codon:yes stop_codon:yes gene_type:complete
MTTLNPGSNALMTKSANDALIDQLRACSTSNEILEFENWFNSKAKTGPLHDLICELLRDRSISRVLAAKWLSTLLRDRDNRINEN